MWIATHSSVEMELAQFSVKLARDAMHWTRFSSLLLLCLTVHCGVALRVDASLDTPDVRRDIDDVGSPEGFDDADTETGLPDADVAVPLCVGSVRQCFPNATINRPRVRVRTIFPNPTGVYALTNTSGTVVDVDLPAAGSAWCQDDRQCVNELGPCLIRREPRVNANAFLLEVVAPHATLNQANFYSSALNIALPGERMQFSMINGYEYGQYSARVTMAPTATWIAPIAMIENRRLTLVHRQGEAIRLQWVPMAAGTLVANVFVAQSPNATDTTRAKCYFDARAGVGEIPARVIEQIPLVPGESRSVTAGTVHEEVLVLTAQTPVLVSAENHVFGAALREVP